MSRRGPALVLLPLLLAACGESRRDVLLITVDTLRPDALGWVAGRNPTPTIDALAAEGFRFPAAISAVPLTLPAHASLFTGSWPPRHGVHDNGYPLLAEPPTLAQVLGRAGYTAAGFISGYPLRAEFGIGRGFDHFDDQLPSAASPWLDRPAGETTAAALAWLQRHHSGEAEAGPWLLWVHYYDPHAPYLAPAGVPVADGPRGAYDAEVAAVDAALAELLAGIDRLAPRPRLTVFTGDHGESLGEHGEQTHGLFVYDSTLTVPMIFHAPGLVPAGTSQAAPRLVDVLPTLGCLLGIAVPAELDGVGLCPLLRGEPQVPPPAYVESVAGLHGYGWAPLSGLRTERWKLILAPTPELYDLAEDPAEETNVYPRDSATVRHLIRQLDRLGLQPGAEAAETAPDPDARAAAALRSLGYVSGMHAPDGASLPDPKDHVEQLAFFELAEAEFLAGNRTSALALLDVVLAEDPDQPYANLRSGQILAQAGRLEEAAGRLRTVLAWDPRQAEASYLLADALSRAGRLDEAIEQWRHTTQLQPLRVAAWINLGVVLLQRSGPTASVEALAQAASLDPKDPVARRNLAEARYRLALEQQAAGAATEARRTLEAACVAEPELRQRAAMDPRLAALLVEG